MLFLIAACAAGLAKAQTIEGEATKRRMAKNNGVVLYLSLAPELTYVEDQTYRGLSATPRPEEAMVNGEVSADAQIAYILAAYPEGAVPDLLVATFGLRYTKGIKVLRHGTTPEAMPVSTRDWPLSGEGVSVALTEGPDTMAVAEIGWLAIRAEVPGKIELVPHRDPKMGARIVSNTPRMMVPIAEMGYLGFGEAGYAPTPELPGPYLGATCVSDTICMELSELEVDFYSAKGGNWLRLGDDTTCRSVGHCLENAPTGACCLGDGTCQVLDRKNCLRNGGRYLGDETQCSPDSCRAAAGGATPAGSEGEMK